MNNLYFTQILKSLALIVLLSGLVACPSPDEPELKGEADKATAEAAEKAKAAEEEAAKVAAEAAEAAKKAEEAKQAGDAEAAKKAEEEAARLAEQEAKFAAASRTARQIAAAVQTAAAGVKRAEAAKEEVSTSLNTLESEAEGFTAGEPFSTWKEQVRQAVLTAKKALRATVAAEDATTAFNKAEEANTAANQGVQVANKVTNFVTSFQEKFVFYSPRGPKVYLNALASPTPEQEQQCTDLLNALNQELSQHTTSGYACTQDGECACKYVYEAENRVMFLEKK